MSATPRAAAPAPPDVLAPDGMALSRFHIVALAVQRAKQLHDGARPRVPVGGHKFCRVALLEVMAHTVSWSVL